MLANKKIFCNTPWYELHIYWDGRLGICCQESQKLYPESATHYNIANMSIAEWFNSAPVTDFRKRILSDQKLPECSRCYHEEDHGGASRRLRSNQKSVIFTRTAFDPSFQQSPGWHAFEHSKINRGKTITHPIDIHVDLGNYCNLACKMCNAKASSKIASQEVKWGIKSSKQYVGTNWTQDQKVWNNFKQQLLEIPGLNNIHFMGGETLLTPKFEDLVDTMIQNKRYDICFSFVTNGTVFNSALLDKLKKFKRVGIEVSVETIDKRNNYVRQGTNTNLVLENIVKYQTHCNDTSITVTLRPTPSAMTIGSYITLLKFALDNKLLIKSNICSNPRFFSVEILPKHVKEQYLLEYLDFDKKLNDIEFSNDYNISDPTNYLSVIKQQVATCINLLRTPTPIDSDQELKKLVNHCRRWDQVYKLNARDLYPELKEVWDKYEY